MAKKYHQGKYKPKNPEKYVGDVNDIVFRSGWERTFMVWADNTPQITRWTSETVIVPYISPVDGKPHRYFVDFAIAVSDNRGNLKKYLIEIKPNKERFPPTGKRKTKQLTEAVMTYHVNQAKWAAAIEYASKRGLEFKVLDEYDLGIKQRKNG